MNTENFEQTDPNDDMLPEYDFSNGVRGKHYQAYRQGHSVTVYQADGTSVTKHFTLEDEAVMLDLDVKEYLSDAQAVNQALRTLISLFPKNREGTEL